MTVRDHDGSIVQFLYGEDSIDVCHSKYLDRFEFLESNFSSIIANSDHELYDKLEKKQAEKLKKEYRNIKKLVAAGRKP